MKQIVGTDPDFMLLDDIDFSAPVEKLPWVHVNYQDHHRRMTDINKKLKEKASWNRPHRFPKPPA